MTFITPLLPSSKGQSRLRIFVIVIVRKSVQIQFKISLKIVSDGLSLTVRGRLFVMIGQDKLKLRGPSRRVAVRGR
jgi:hypothetical protein